MKTCISTYCYWRLISQNQMTYMDAVDKIKELGMDAVEICVFNDAVPKDKTLRQYVKELVTHARESGLEVPIFTCGANMYCEEPEKELVRLEEMVDIAAENDIHLMRHDITYAFLGNEQAKTPRHIIRAVAPYVRELSLYAKEKGVKTCSENHGKVMEDGYRMEMLFDEVNCDNYGLLCDIGNFSGVDEDCATAVGLLLPHICFVHAKDAFFRDGMMYDPGEGFVKTRAGNYKRSTIFGHGQIPTFKILSAIKRSGYDGYVSLEFEGIEENIMAVRIGAENLKRMVTDIEKILTIV